MNGEELRALAFPNTRWLWKNASQIERRVFACAAALATSGGDEAAVVHLPGDPEVDGQPLYRVLQLFAGPMATIERTHQERADRDVKEAHRKHVAEIEDENRRRRGLPPRER